MSNLLLIFTYANKLVTSFYMQSRLDVLGLHEFDSVRKRMSVVIRFPNNAVKVLVKGADTSMFSILADSRMNDHVRSATQKHLSEYSSQGLRTLVVAARDLKDEELQQWQYKYEDASTSLTDRATKLRQTASSIECNLKLLGATAIEDKLQDGVPEAIECLRQAGIKVWVLTGDKQETAISIAVSCKLLTADTQQIIINGNSEDECRNLLIEAKAKYGIKSPNKQDHSLKCKKDAENDYLEVPGSGKSFSVQQCYAGKKEGVANTTAPLALIIDGNSLVYILEKDLESEARISFPSFKGLVTTLYVLVCAIFFLILANIFLLVTKFNQLQTRHFVIGFPYVFDPMLKILHLYLIIFFFSFSTAF